MKFYPNHHIWCNFPIKPVEECEFCKEQYPEDNLTPEELAKKYFPDAILRRTR
jgi:hypothetical protein